MDLPQAFWTRPLILFRRLHSHALINSQGPHHVTPSLGLETSTDTLGGHVHIETTAGHGNSHAWHLNVRI